MKKQGKEKRNILNGTYCFSASFLEGDYHMQEEENSRLVSPLLEIQNTGFSDIKLGFSILMIGVLFVLPYVDI